MNFPAHRTTVSLGIVALTAIASVFVFPDLPQQVAIHFDSAGQPDNFLGKSLAVGLLPALAVLITGLFVVLPRLDPLGENFESFERYYDLLAIVTVAILGYVHGLILAYNLGYAFQMQQALAPVLAVVGITVGYVIEHARQNWFVGIRTPWTLSSEAVWNKTNQRSGVLFRIAGVLALLAVPFPEHLELVAIVPLVLATLIPTVYSYVLYRRLESARLTPRSGMIQLRPVGGR